MTATLPFEIIAAVPEGPEILRTVDRLDAALRRRKAKQVHFAFDHLKSYERQLAGRTIRGVEARGKAILVRFSGDWTVYSHNQLYGRWVLVEPGALPSTGRTLRFAIHTRACSALLYSASEIEVLLDGELDDHPYLARLGPDLLGTTVSAGEIAARATGRRFRNRSFAALLLDQGFLAGVGNYLRSEILFFAGLHPRRRPIDCSAEELRRLAETALEITRRAYETGGVTNEPRRADALRREGRSFGQFRHAVFGRDREPCWDCGTVVRKEDLAGRRAYFCSACQPHDA